MEKKIDYGSLKGSCFRTCKNRSFIFDNLSLMGVTSLRLSGATLLCAVMVITAHQIKLMYLYFDNEICLPHKTKSFVVNVSGVIFVNR